MREVFKLGDEATCILEGRGVVSGVIEHSSFYPIRVKFESGKSGGYTSTGKSLVTNMKPSLYHGHGEIKIEFIKDKEIKYEWQWLYMYIDTNAFDTTNFYKNSDDAKSDFSENVKLISRIEESKREVKND